jgi:hypothetical protein
VGVPQPGTVEVHPHASLGTSLAQQADLVDRLDGPTAEVVGVLDDDEGGVDLVGAGAGDHETQRVGGGQQPTRRHPRP